MRVEQPDHTTPESARVRSSSADIVERDAPRSRTTAIWNELKLQPAFPIVQQHADDFPMIVSLSAARVIVQPSLLIARKNVPT